MRHTMGGRIRPAFAVLCAMLLSSGREATAGAAPSPGGLLYVCNQDAATVTVIDAAAGAVMEVVDLQELGFSPGAKPHHTAVEPDGSFWYVSLIGDGKVLKFTRHNELVGAAEFETPGLLALDPHSDRLYVGRSMAAVNPPPRIGVIRRSDMAIEEVDVFLPRPHAIATGPDGGVVYTASLAENRIAAVRVDEEALELVDVPGPHHSFVQFAVSPNGRTLVATAEMSGSLLVFDLADPTHPAFVRSVPVGTKPWHPVFSPDGRFVYFGDNVENRVTVVNADTWEVAATIEGESLAEPHGSAISPDGRWLYISNRNLKGTYGGGSDAPVGPATAARKPPGTVTVIDTQTRRIVRVIEVGPYAAGLSLGP